ncbi:ATP-binding protein [Luteibacter sp. dw_328]|uniref:AAA family ATPase n=1 Tax=Luteibacter sp. dw_328 TaxID=2719796 RepID=UPI001BD4DA4D|nr:ATP-binding protein [Luteibacter sp. dw_328]
MEKDLDRPIAYLICGKVGSGKTTYATRLATERQAPIFSIDAWMVTLFGADTPSSGAGGPIDFAWYAERVDRCEAMIWELCKQQIAQHRNVVLDLGFLRVARRQRFVEWAAAAGAEVQVHLLEVDITTRRERVAARNRLRAGTFSFAVTDEMFDFAETLFEPLAATEIHRVVLDHDVSPA